MPVQVRRAADRLAGGADGLLSRRSFSFGEHYDPLNVGHAVLVAHNDDVVSGGAGYPTHPHRDLEIVTWVLAGGLRHEDAVGEADVIVPGVVQRLSAGRGVRHAELHDPASGPQARFVQMWVLPDEPGADPSYVRSDVTASLSRGGMVPLASGRAEAAVSLGNRDATLHVARLGRAGADSTALLPDAPYLHVFLATGSATLEGAGELGEGDAVRLTGAGQRLLTAGAAGCEALVWEMHRR